MVTMSMDTLLKIYNQMEKDDPQAEDDQPVSFVVWNTQVAPFTPNLMNEAIYSTEVIDIATPSQSPSGISEYSIIIPHRHHRTYVGERFGTFPRLSKLHHSHGYYY
uniref:Uncharacterized protein n=1 Tax=Setaria digitata TaxID=48799 RepID=A0A915Q1U8_9BILA